MRREFARDRRGEDETVANTIARTYPHPVSAVWAAFTSIERLKRWFGGVEGDLQVGGRYQIKGNASGTIEACEPERGFRVTWEFGGAVGWVDVTLSAEGGDTTVTLRHEGRVADLPPGFWEKLGPGAIGVGWEIWFMGLGLHLDAPEAVMPEDFEENWAVSDEGQAFIRTSAESWARAGIVGGEPEAAMQATVPALFAFYTGIVEGT
jgi:uncharacterized protein YndB with AHSA1/START domain